MIARSGDQVVGICSAHDSPKPTVGTIVSSSSRTLIEGAPPALIGDTVVAYCGHCGVIASSSRPTVIVEGKPVALVGDSVAGAFSGVIATSAGTIL